MAPTGVCLIQPQTLVTSWASSKRQSCCGKTTHFSTITLSGSPTPNVNRAATGQRWFGWRRRRGRWRLRGARSGGVRRSRRNPPRGSASGVRRGSGRAGESSPARLAHRQGLRPCRPPRGRPDQGLTGGEGAALGPFQAYLPRFPGLHGPAFGGPCGPRHCLRAASSPRGPASGSHRRGHLGDRAPGRGGLSSKEGARASPTSGSW